MKYPYVFVIFFIFTISCVNLENICKESIRINGEVIYAIPTPNKTRMVVIQTTNGEVVIHRVPLEQPLTNIPVCYKHGKLYWVMP